MGTTLEKKVINRSMKKFRSIKADAKRDGIDLNAILYVGDRLTPLQMQITKELIYSFVELNTAVGKANADIVVDNVVTEITLDTLLNKIFN